MTRLLVCLATLLAGSVIATSAGAQAPVYYPPTTGYGTGLAPVQTYPPTIGATYQTPAYAYPQRYQYGMSPYVLSPYVFTPSQPSTPRRSVGPAYPYTDEQYGKILGATLADRQGDVAGVRRRAGSLLDVTTPTQGSLYGTAEARIVDIADRGVLVADTQEEIRLRGVRVPSEQSPDDVTRYYAREASRTLRELISDEPVYVVLDEPIRDSGGNLLGTVFLRDGTNLNRLLLEYGYGQMTPDDFAPDENPADLALAEEEARSARLGLWSRR